VRKAAAEEGGGLNNFSLSRVHTGRGLGPAGGGRITRSSRARTTLLI
jgi:hypothetical protein